METLQITKKNAASAYNKADEKGKSLLADLLGKENIIPVKITDRVKTFEDACDVLGIDTDVLSYGLDPDTLAYEKLKIIAKALNEGWTPNWNNSNQYKWTPWFYMNDPGFRFGDSYRWSANADYSGGSRLVFHSDVLANYAGQQFLEIYKAFMS